MSSRRKNPYLHKKFASPATRDASPASSQKGKKEGKGAKKQRNPKSPEANTSPQKETPKAKAQGSGAVAKTFMMIAAATIAKGSDGFCLANLVTAEAPSSFGLLNVSFPKSVLRKAGWQIKQPSLGSTRSYRPAVFYEPEVIDFYEQQA